MIQANELRIGNWIADRGGKEWQIDHWEYKDKVSAKPHYFVLPAMSMANSFHPYTEYVDYLKPVELTEEWLVRFGFECEDWNCLIDIHKGQKLNLCLRSFCIYIGSDYDWNLLCNIKYIHQLQNLYFALTGQELELNI